MRRTLRQDHPVEHHRHYPDQTLWNDRIKAVKQGGIAAVADVVIAGWLTKDFREREPQIAARMKEMMIATPVEGYLGCCEAVSTLDHREILPKIKVPTLVIAGRHDMATTVAAAEFIRSRFPAQACHRRRRAYRQCRAPDAFTDALVGFLTQRYDRRFRS